MTKCVLCVLSGMLYLDGAELPKPEGRPVVTISGAIERTNHDGSAKLDLAALDSLKQQEIITGNPWESGEKTYQGPSLKDLLAHVGAQSSHIRIIALNDYIIDVDAKYVDAMPFVFVTRVNGSPPRVRDRGPAMLMLPFDSDPSLRREDLFSYCVWQIREIKVLMD